MWSLLWLIPGLLFLLLIWLFFAPIQLRIDTHRDIYMVRIAGVARAWLDVPSGKWRIRFRVFFFPVNIRMNGRKKKRKKKDRPEKKRKKKKRSAARISLRLVIRYMGTLLRTFRLKRFRIELDTEDYPRNAQLFALQPPLHQLGIDLDINFEGRNELDLLIENRASRIAWSLLWLRLTQPHTTPKNNRTNGNES